MEKMTSHERIARMYAHREADRVPICDSPWQETIERWEREGMPKGMDYRDYFDLDKTASIDVDTSPRYPKQTLEETDRYVIYTTEWGATLRQWKHATSTPEFLDFKTTDPQKWLEAKARMTPDDDRIPWETLRLNYRRWREEGRWIEASFWFGFDVTHSWSVGTETFLIALKEEPEWCVDMFNRYLDMDLALFEKIWDAGYHFDSVCWPDDMGYKNRQFFSIGTYRELLKPVHRRAIEWAHAHGAKAHLHSCGDIHPFIPELIGIGLDALNPLEVKAGMDPVAIKRQYGSSLVLHGGINAVLWDQPEVITAEMRRVIPALREGGGYIFASDHSVPATVSLKDFGRIVSLAKELGSFDR